MSLTYRYNVNEAQFLNYFVAHDYAKKVNGFVDFKISDQDVKIFENVDLDVVKQTPIREFYKQKLLFLRETFPKIRLHYSAGTDSHTILSMAQELGIEFDDIVIEVASMWGDPELDREMNPGIAYAQQHNIKNFRILRPSIELYERFLDPYWIKDICGSHRFGFRAKLDVHLRNEETMINLTGKDKPWIYVSDDNKYYWILTDASYSLQMRWEHVLFYLDSFVPEAAVKQAYNAVNYLKTYFPNFRGLHKGEHWHWDKDGRDEASHIAEIKKFNKELGRTDALTEDLLVSTRYGKTQPMFLSKKHQGPIEECRKIGRHDVVEGFFNGIQYVIDTYRDQPHCIDITANGYADSVDRMACVFEINDNYIKKVDDQIIDLNSHNKYRKSK